MNKQILSLSFVFLLALLVSFSSATISFAGVPSTIFQNTTTFTFNVTTDSAETVDVAIADIANLRDSSKVTFGLDKTSIIFSAAGTEVVTVTVSSSDFDFKYDTYSTMITANASVSTNRLSSKVSISATNFKCATDSCDTKYLDYDDYELSVFDGIGDEDDGFYPMDTLQVDFTIENSGSDDLETIVLYACVYDIDAGKCVFSEDDFEFSESKFDIDEDDDLDITGTLYLDIDNLRAGNTDYRLLITAKGKVDSKNDTVDGMYTYVYLSKDFEIITDDDFVIVSDVEIINPVVSCGDTVTIVGKLWNVGSTDFEDDEVYLNIWSTELGFDEVITLSDDLDSFDSEDFEYTFNVPKGLVEGKKYAVHYNIYDEDKISSKNLYENSQDKTAEYKYFIEINGDCSIIRPVVSAKLENSEAVVGEKLSIAINVVNTDSVTNTYSLSISGYDSSVANFVSLSENSVTLTAGQSTTVYAVFEPVSAGSLDFVLDMKDTDSNVFTQPVSLNVDNKKGFEFSFDNELFLYLLAGCLGLFVIILFVLVLVNAKKQKVISRKD